MLTVLHHSVPTRRSFVLLWALRRADVPDPAVRGIDRRALAGDAPRRIRRRHDYRAWPSDDGVRGQLSVRAAGHHPGQRPRSEEHTSELQSLMRISYAVFCLKKKKNFN